MGRDPEYLAFIREVEKGVTLRSPSVEDERASHLAALAQLRRSPIAQVEDLALAGPDGVISARLYHPAPGQVRPGLVFFHGGGFYLGSVEAYDPIVRSLVTATGCAFVSVEYPLAPEDPYPAAVDCALDATLDVARRATDLGLDPHRLGVAGDSAGANLAAATALALRAEPTLALQLLIYGVYDLASDPQSRPDPDGIRLDDGGWPAARDRYLDGADPFEPYASPILAPDLAGLPPTVLVTAEFDKLREQGNEFAARLRAARVPVTLVEGTGLDHGFLNWVDYAARPAEALAEFAAAVVTRFAP
jgi:acetyl esterase